MKSGIISNGITAPDRNICGNTNENVAAIAASGRLMNREIISANPANVIEPNIRIEVEDSCSNIHGDYIIKSMTLPLTHEGTMSITALRAFNRL